MYRWVTLRCMRSGRGTFRGRGDGFNEITILPPQFVKGGVKGPQESSSLSTPPPKGTTSSPTMPPRDSDELHLVPHRDASRAPIAVPLTPRRVLFQKKFMRERKSPEERVHEVVQRNFLNKVDTLQHFRCQRCFYFSRMVPRQANCCPKCKSPKLIWMRQWAHEVEHTGNLRSIR